MSRNKHRKYSAQAAPSARRAKILMASFVVLTLMTAGAMLAQVGPKKRERLSSGVTPATPLTNNLAKEYVYSGGRLVATIEPTASPNGDDAQYVSQSLPQPDVFGLPGQNYPISVTMRNTGTTTWLPTDGYKLGSQNPANNTTWRPNRVPLTQVVPPGSQFTFTFSASKPEPPACGAPCSFQWQMVKDTGGGPVWFGEKSKNHLIPGGTWLPTGIPNYATLVSQSVPPTVQAGDPFTAIIVLNNAGSTEWIPQQGYRLGSQIPEDNTDWGFNRVELQEKVKPGLNTTFIIHATAPTKAGMYNFQWQMIQEGGVGWFGTLTQSATIEVRGE